MEVTFIKSEPMSATEIKELLHQRIEQVDESFLNVMYAMMEAYIKEQKEAALEAEIMAIPPDPSLRQLTAEEMEERLAKSEAQFETGDYMTIEELRKESETW